MSPPPSPRPASDLHDSPRRASGASVPSSRPGAALPSPGGANRIARLHARLADVFAAAGYDVRSDVALPGRDGRHVTVDLLAERRDGVVRSAIVVDCRSAGDLLEVTHVARIDQLRRELGVSGAVVPTFVGCTREAYDTARRLDVDLWGPDELAVHLGRIVVSEFRSTAGG